MKIPTYIFRLLRYLFYNLCLPYVRLFNNLVSTGVSPQKLSLIDVEVVRFLSTDMVLWDQQGVKVLLSCDHWVKLRVDWEKGVATWCKVPAIHVLDNTVQDVTQWMVLLKMEVLSQVWQNVWGDIGHVVCWVLYPSHSNLKHKIITKRSLKVNHPVAYTSQKIVKLSATVCCDLQNPL